MKGTTSSSSSEVAIRREAARRKRVECSICKRRIWFDPIHLIEPEGAPEPRLSWVLCNGCYQALLAEMRKSPVRSPLRLRVAMGIVASERWPHAYSTKLSNFVSDRRWIIFIAVGFILAMIVHLALIVLIAPMK